MSLLWTPPPTPDFEPRPTPPEADLEDAIGLTMLVWIAAGLGLIWAFCG